MISRLIWILFSLIAALNGSGQNAVTKQRELYTSKNNYKDFVIVGHQIWALTDKGKLKIFNLTDYRPVSSELKIEAPISAIAKDRDSNIVMGYGGRIVVCDRRTKKRTILGSYKGRLSGVVFTSNRTCFLIKDNGIQDLRTHKRYFPDTSLNRMGHYNGHWFKEPTYFLDHEDNLWMGLGFGEWGGDLFVFNTSKREFQIPTLEKGESYLEPVKSIFSDGSKIYVSGGLCHFSLSGSILEFDNFKEKRIFTSETRKDKSHKVIDGEYIGPAAFNYVDHCIYYYSQNGIFKGFLGKNLLIRESWTRLAVPKLSWTNGQPDAIGSPMNVLKMEFADGKTLVFVTQLNGIGIFDGQSITLIK